MPGSWKAGALDAVESAAEVPEAAAEEDVVSDGFGLPPAAFAADGVVPTAEAEGEGAEVVDAESAAAVAVPNTTDEGTAETPFTTTPDWVAAEEALAEADDAVADAVAEADCVESIENGIEEAPLTMTPDWLAVAVATEADAESDVPALEDALAAEVETALSVAVLEEAPTVSVDCEFDEAVDEAELSLVDTLADALEVTDWEDESVATEEDAEL